MDDPIELLKKVRSKQPNPNSPGSLSQVELEDTLRKAGWDEQLIPKMAAIGMAESALTPDGRAKINSYNPGRGANGKKTVEESVGVWQINMHPTLGRTYDRQKLASDPVYNAQVAKELYDERQKRGKNGLTHWGAYTDGRYKKFYTGTPLSTSKEVSPLDLLDQVRKTQITPQRPEVPYEPDKLWPVGGLKPGGPSVNVDQDPQSQPASSNGQLTPPRVSREYQLPSLTYQEPSPEQAKLRKSYNKYIQDLKLEDNDESVKQFNSHLQDLHKSNKLPGRSTTLYTPAQLQLQQQVAQQVAPQEDDGVKIVNDDIRLQGDYAGKPKDMSKEDFVIRQLIPHIASQTGLSAGDIEAELRDRGIEGLDPNSEYFNFQARPDLVDAISLRSVKKREILKGLVASGEPLDPDQVFADFGIDPREYQNAIEGKDPQYAEEYRQYVDNKAKYEKQVESYKTGMKDEPSSTAPIRAARDMGWITEDQAKNRLQVENDLAKRIIDEEYLWSSPLDLSGIGQARLGLSPVGKPTTQEEIKAKSIAKGRLKIEEILKKYPSLSKYADDEYAQKEGGFVGLLDESVKTAGRYVFKVPSTLMETAAVGVTATSGYGVEGPLVDSLMTAAKDWRESIDKHAPFKQKEEYKYNFIANEVSEGFAQVLVQTLLAPLTGGASIFLPLAEGGTAQFRAAREAGASKGTQLAAAGLGAALAVPDVLLKVGYIGKIVKPSSLIGRLYETTYGRVSKFFPKKEAELITRASVGEFVKQGVKYGTLSGAVEYSQERLEDTGNKFFASVTYNPNLTWRDILVPTLDEQRGYAAAGIVGIFGGNFHAATKVLGSDQIKEGLKNLPQLLEENKISQRYADEVTKIWLEELKSREVSTTAKPLGKRAIKSSIKNQLKLSPEYTAQLELNRKAEDKKASEPVVNQYQEGETPQFELVGDDPIQLLDSLRSQAESFNLSRQPKSKNVPPQNQERGAIEVKKPIKEKMEQKGPRVTKDVTPKDAPAAPIAKVQQIQQLTEPKKPGLSTNARIVSIKKEIRTLQSKIATDPDKIKSLREELAKLQLAPKSPVPAKPVVAPVKTTPSKVEAPVKVKPVELKEDDQVLTAQNTTAYVKEIDPKNPKYVILEDDDGKTSRHLISTVKTKSDPTFFKSAIDNFLTTHRKNKNFSTFIKDTKVVDYRGLPQIMFHGAVNFKGNIFDPQESVDFGHHFGDVEQANARVSHPKRGMDGVQTHLPMSELIPVVLNIKNPIRMRDEGMWTPLSVLGQLKEQNILTKEEINEINPKMETPKGAFPNGIRYSTKQLEDRIKSALEAKGYDGMVYTNEYEGEVHKDSWIAFRPEQIKSIWNNGEFKQHRDSTILKAAADKAKALGATGTAEQWINRNEKEIKDWNKYLKAKQDESGPKVIGIGLEPDPTPGILALKADVEEIFKKKSSPEALKPIVEVDLKEYLKEDARRAAVAQNPQAAAAVWKYNSDPEGATKEIEKFIQENRKLTLSEWHQYLTKENPIYAKDPFFKDWVWTDLIKLRDTRPDLPLGLDKAALAAVYADVKDKPNSSSFQKLYEKKVTELMLADAETSEILKVPDGQWIKIPQTDRDHPDFKANVSKVQAISDKAWCTSQGMAEAYLPLGDFWVLVKNQKSGLAVRFNGNAVAEIQGKENNGTIPEEFLPDVKTLVRSGKVELTISSMDQILRALRESKFKAKLAEYEKDLDELSASLVPHESLTTPFLPTRYSEVESMVTKARQTVAMDFHKTKKGKEYENKSKDLFLKHFDPEYREKKPEKKILSDRQEIQDKWQPEINRIKAKYSINVAVRADSLAFLIAGGQYGDGFELTEAKRKEWKKSIDKEHVEKWLNGTTGREQFKDFKGEERDQLIQATIELYPSKIGIFADTFDGKKEELDTELSREETPEYKGTNSHLKFIYSQLDDPNLPEYFKEAAKSGPEFVEALTFTDDELIDILDKSNGMGEFTHPYQMSGDELKEFIKNPPYTLKELVNRTIDRLSYGHDRQPFFNKKENREKLSALIDKYYVNLEGLQEGKQEELNKELGKDSPIELWKEYFAEDGKRTQIDTIKNLRDHYGEFYDVASLAIQDGEKLNGVHIGSGEVSKKSLEEFKSTGLTDKAIFSAMKNSYWSLAYINFEQFQEASKDNKDLPEAYKIDQIRKTAQQILDDVAEARFSTREKDLNKELETPLSPDEKIALEILKEGVNFHLEEDPDYFDGTPKEDIDALSVESLDYTDEAPVPQLEGTGRTYQDLWEGLSEDEKSTVKLEAEKYLQSKINEKKKELDKELSTPVDKAYDWLVDTFDGETYEYYEDAESDDNPTWDPRDFVSNIIKEENELAGYRNGLLFDNEDLTNFDKRYPFIKIYSGLKTNERKELEDKLVDNFPKLVEDYKKSKKAELDKELGEDSNPKIDKIVEDASEVMLAYLEEPTEEESEYVTNALNDYGSMPNSPWHNLTDAERNLVTLGLEKFLEEYKTEKKAELDSEIQKSADFEKQLQQYEKAKFNREFIATDFTAKVDKDGNIEISPKVAVLISRAEGKDKKLAPVLFTGGMLRLPQVNFYTAQLGNLIATAPKEWSKKDLAPLVKVYQTLKAQIPNKSALLYVDKSVLPHEMQHKLRYVHSGYQEKVRDYYEDFDALYKELESIQIEAFEEYFSRVYFNNKEYNKLRGSDKEILHEETFVHLVDNKYHDLGLTIDQAAKFIDTTIKAYVKKNGTRILREQGRWTKDAKNKEIIENNQGPKAPKSKSSGRGKGSQESPAGDGSRGEEAPPSEASADVGPSLTERAYPNNIARHTQLNVEDLHFNSRYYDPQARSPVEREAYNWLQDRGISNAYFEAFNQPVNALGVAKRQAVMSYLDAQISEFTRQNNLPRAQAVYDQLVSLVNIISPEATDWGQAISQMAQWSYLNPDAVIYTLENQRERAGKKRGKLDLETQEKVRQDAKDLKALDKDILTIQDILRDSNSQATRKSLENVLKLKPNAIKTLRKYFGGSSPSQILKAAPDGPQLNRGPDQSNHRSLDTLPDDFPMEALMNLGKIKYLEGKSLEGGMTLTDFKSSVINELEDNHIDPAGAEPYMNSLYLKVRELVRSEQADVEIARAKKRYKTEDTAVAMEKLAQEKAIRAAKASLAAHNLRDAKKPKDKRTALDIAIDNEFGELSDEALENAREDVHIIKDKAAYYKKYSKQGMKPNEITPQYLKMVERYLDIADSLKQARLTIKAQKDLAPPGGFRYLSPTEQKDYENQLFEKRREKGKKLADFNGTVRHLTERPEGAKGKIADWYLRMNRAGETGLTAALSTTSHNVIAQRGTKLLNAFEIAGEVAIGKFERRIGRDIFSKGIFDTNDATRLRDLIFEELKSSTFPQIRKAVMDQYRGDSNLLASLGTAFAHKDRVVQGILAHNPDLYEAMIGKFSYGDEDLKRKPVDSSYNKVEKGVEYGVRAVEQWIHWVTTFNALQEKHFRFATFLGVLSADLKARGIDPEMVFNGNIDMLDRFQLERAVKRALEDTFGEDIPKDTDFGRFLSSTSNAAKWIPFPLNPVLFRRFLFNSSKFLYEHTPLALAKVATDKGLNKRDFMKVVSGMGLFTIALQLLSQFGSDDDDPLTLTFPGWMVPDFIAEGDKVTLKMAAYNPLSSFLILANVVNRARKGKKPLKNLNEIWKLFGVDTRYPNLAMEWFKSLISVVGSEEQAKYTKFSDISKTVAGRGLSAYLKAFNTLKDIQSTFDTEEATIRDYYDEPFIGELKKVMPMSEKMTKFLTGENSLKKEIAATGDIDTKEHPALNQMGFTLVPERQVGAKFTPAEDYLDNELRIDREKNVKFHKTPEERRSTAITAQLYNALDKGISIEKFNERVDYYTNLGTISRESSLKLKNASEYSTPLLRQASQATIPMLVEAIEYANLGETIALKEFLIKKARSKFKDNSLSTEEKQALIRVFPELSTELH